MTKLEGLPRSLVLQAAAMIVVSIGCCGCNRGPKAVHPPDWNPSQLATRVIDQLDSSGDEVVDKQEAGGAPSVADAFTRIDTNHDGKLTYQELHDRFAHYERVGRGLSSQSLFVQVDGRPAIKVRVDLIPEDFVKDILTPASGVTDDSGRLSPQAKGSEYEAMQDGFYQAILFQSPESAEPMASVAPIGVEISPFGSRDSTAILEFQRK